MQPQIDHLVVDVQNRIDEALQRYRALGFTLTERGRHSMGSVNHLAVFGTDFLELLGTGEPGGPVRQELIGFPVGLNGLVFKLDNAAGRHALLQRAGVPVQPVNTFGRPALIDGKREEVRFHTVRLPPRTVFDGRVYYCEHLTPQFVWRPEWQSHGNGAQAITRILIAARDPVQVSGWFPRLLDVPAARREAGGTLVTQVGAVRIEVAPLAAVATELGDMAPDPAGRADYMALVGIRVQSLKQARDALRAGSISGMREANGRLLVPPTEGMNATLAFTE